MAYDLWHLSQRRHIARSREGDHTLLIDLLRSDEKLTRETRDYLADQISREPKKRFSTQDKRGVTLATQERDRELLTMTANAKFHIICNLFRDAYLLFESGVEEALGTVLILNPICAKWSYVRDSEALDLLAEWGCEVTQDELNNAKRRYPDWKQLCRDRPLATFHP